MSREQYQDDCPGCRPVIVNMETGKREPDTSPVMVALLKIWDTTSPMEREAYHRVMCQNSRVPNDLNIVQFIVERLQNAVR